MATSGMRARARALAAPSVRRIRREVQWHRSGGRRILDREPVDVAPHEVARHATPLFRALAGVDPQLQRNKVVNLGLAIERLDGLLLRGPGSGSRSGGRWASRRVGGGSWTGSCWTTAARPRASAVGCAS